MSSWRLVWVGRRRADTPETILADRYLQRLNSFVSVDDRLVKPLTGSRSTDVVRRQESQRIFKHLDDGDFVVLLDERGRGMTSRQLAAFLTRQASSGRRLSWVIGGSMGVSDSLRRRADFVLSLSKMTLPHAVARAILAEQLYRAMCINAHHPYHHEG